MVDFFRFCLLKGSNRSASLSVPHSLPGIMSAKDLRNDEGGLVGLKGYMEEVKGFLPLEGLLGEGRGFVCCCEY